MTTSREDQRDRLLEAALVHVPFDGWSRRSLLAGARDLGVEPGLARRLFPRGGDDLLAQLERWADRRMLAQVDTGALAAMRMREAMRKLNAERGSEDLLLKIGIHEGPCIAVNLNERQDYFGQTVNIASRVQGLSTDQAIHVTGPVLETPAVRRPLALVVAGPHLRVDDAFALARVEVLDAHAAAPFSTCAMWMYLSGNPRRSAQPFWCIRQEESADTT